MYNAAGLMEKSSTLSYGSTPPIFRTVDYSGPSAAQTYPPRSPQRLRLSEDGMPIDNLCQRPRSAGKFGLQLMVNQSPPSPGPARDRTPSCVSAISSMSEASWVTAVASVPEQETEEDPDMIENIRKTDSGIAIEDSHSRRKSTSESIGAPGPSTARRRSTSLQTEISKPSEPPSMSTLREEPKAATTARGDKSRRSSCSSATATLSPKARPRTSQQHLSRRSTTGTVSSTRTRKTTSNSSTCFSYDRTTRSVTSSRTGRHSTPPSSPEWSVGSRSDTASDHAANIRRRKRKDIRNSLEQKYPNDRCHGEFLPFQTAFAHSADSLCPVRFTSTREPSINHDGASPDARNIVSNPEPAPSEAGDYAGSILQPHTIAWKNIDNLRAEYEKVDRGRRGVWGWFRRHVLVVLGCGGVEFWEEGDDAGSVRRYRLALPEKTEEPEEKFPVPRRVKSEDTGLREKAVLPALFVPPTSAPEESREILVGEDHRSIKGVCEGRGVAGPTTTPMPRPRSSVGTVRSR